MTTLYQIAELLKKWHYKSLSLVEKKFIDDIINFGSEQDEDLIEERSQKQIAWLKRIGKRFLIN